MQLREDGVEAVHRVAEAGLAEQAAGKEAAADRGRGDRPEAAVGEVCEEANCEDNVFFCSTFNFIHLTQPHKNSMKNTSTPIQYQAIPCLTALKIYIYSDSYEIYISKVGKKLLYM